jgi:transcriptional regulator with XRE-family HTH domain
VDTVAPEPGSAAIRLAEVIGKNAHRLRKAAELTLDQVSIAARKRGLNWSESRVADFESGRVAPNLATLVAFCLALEDAGCAAAALPELLRSETPIQVNESLLLSSEQIVELTIRRPASRTLPSPEWVTAAITASWEAHKASVFAGASVIAGGITDTPGATEERTRKALGISRTELTELSATLWGRSFSAERDRRAGAGANAQKRGQVSRELRKELRAAIEAATGGDEK